MHHSKNSESEDTETYGTRNQGNSNRCPPEEEIGIADAEKHACNDRGMGIFFAFDIRGVDIFQHARAHKEEKQTAQNSDRHLDKGDIDDHLETEKQGDHKGELHDAVPEGNKGAGVGGFIAFSHSNGGDRAGRHNA